MKVEILRRFKSGILFVIRHKLAVTDRYFIGVKVGPHRMIFHVANLTDQNIEAMSDEELMGVCHYAAHCVCTKQMRESISSLSLFFGGEDIPNAEELLASLAIEGSPDFLKYYTINSGE